ncbi:hypothetical protein J31TS4_10120 [Paenibacillus sp. J31TS4]|uniref:sugar phosphate isomerase/epimerase family protein n=1 Tax=Paenibacillus sp. J31TS4 TaxID=2807195 RepID=UPI001B1839F4|nr:sugar phosphate isomerase/epimerase [Paenibacillus sp. J31TS4]GIP37732.1 hypothetical protein J31TS4_10120 [Paenibacillus sp. J31TS4]
MVQLACMTLPYTAYPLERAIEGIASAGYRYVALGGPHEGQDIFPPEDGEAVSRVRELLGRYNLKPIALVCSTQLAPAQPFELALHRLEVARELGIREVLTLGTWGYRKFPDEPLPEEELREKNRQYVERMRELAVSAERHGLTITIKPHTGNTASARVLLDTLAAIGSASVSASYDPGNVHFYEGMDTQEDLALMGGRVYSFVAKDHRGGRAHLEFPVPGEGDIPFRQQFALLQQSGYNGPVIVERVDGVPSSDPLPLEEIDSRIARARTNLEAMLREAGYGD